MLVGVSVAVIATAFVVLVIYLVKTLVAAKDSLEQAAKTLQEIQQTVDELGYEVKQVVRQASEVTADVQHKMKLIDPVMDSVNHVGEALSEITLAAKQASAAMVQSFRQTKARRGVRPSAARPASPAPEERPQSSYTAGGEAASKKSDPGWMKWADIAATVWQKVRS
ncbi:DUF948 domain-containing protein [Paenibacillus azoreducens]|uniref:DUF948 domain-containing protein n=1 Tax=Paenibacillus azoreducens TaxID=116718 RepID=UPI0039F546C0